jgi:ABC-type branched-subunit amino acid transport system ATPase component
MSEILKINDLWSGYKADLDILRGVSMEVQQGEAIGIIGLNGSGKSTLGKAIMNMIPYRRGQIYFEGNDVTGLTTSQLSHRGISIMQQGGRVFQTLSVWDNLKLALSKHPDTLKTLQGIIPMLQVPKKELQRTMADKLSGGQKHQLSLAMTLATHPRLVILDEPSAGLSPKAVDEMYQLLQTVRDTLGITIILIEQNIARAINYCNRCAMMQTGNINMAYDRCELAFVEKEMFNFK